MKTDIVNDISPPITYLAKFWFLSYGPKLLSANKIAVFFMKEVNDEVYFRHAYKH